MSKKPGKFPLRPSRYSGDSLLTMCKKAQEAAEYEKRFMRSYRREAFRKG